MSKAAARLTAKILRSRVHYALVESALPNEGQAAYRQWLNVVGECAKLGLCNELAVQKEWPQHHWGY